jgi:hypothetical protein
MMSNDEAARLAEQTGMSREKVTYFLPDARKLRIATPGMTLAEALRKVSSGPAGGRGQNGYSTK